MAISISTCPFDFSRFLHLNLYQTTQVGQTTYLPFFPIYLLTSFQRTKHQKRFPFSKNGNSVEAKMDWYTWLYKTNLDPSVIYEYGLLFTRNELQEEDICHLDHEFLQSMGILVAKHRLEIIKLARKEAETNPNGITRLVSAINKTKKLLSKKWSSINKHSSPSPSPIPYRTQWTGALRRTNARPGVRKELVHVNNIMVSNINANINNMGLVTRRQRMKSGPLDMRSQEKLMVSNRSLSASGPLDGKVNERLRNNNWTPKRDVGPGPGRSPTKSGPLGVSPKINFYCKDKVGGGFEEVQSLWSLMFQDMKPT